MLDTDARERYLRHILLKEIGAQGQQKLTAARILVVGAGGVGGPVIQYLAAAGAGRLTIADDDRVALSNLQRQTIYRDEDVGALKAERAAAFARALNPTIEVTARAERLDGARAQALFGDHDLVIEGVDTIEARQMLNAASVAARTPLVSAALGRFEAQVSVFKPWAGPDLPCYRCFVAETPPREAVLTCAEEGVAGPLAGVAGAVAALEAVKEIAGAGETLAGRLFIFDGLRLTARTVRLPRDPECSVCSMISRLRSVP
jgi:adenylyltransferase/sulfurtransferase